MRGVPFTGCTLTATAWSGAAPQPGDFIVTTTGTSYRVEAARPRAAGGFRIDVTRWPPGEVPADAMVHEWAWNRRPRSV